MFKNQKNGLRNFENPFQIFILSQWMFPECHKSCEIHSKALFSSLRRYKMTSTVSLRAVQSWKIADNHVRNFENPFLKFKNQISTFSWMMYSPTTNKSTSRYNLRGERKSFQCVIFYFVPPLINDCNEVC